jgi:hypothetical protein
MRSQTQPSIRVSSWITAVATGLLLTATTSMAFADFSRKVTATFKGQIVVSSEALTEGKNDKATVDGIKKARLNELPSHDSGEVKAWTFHYTAFLGKSAAASLKIKFYTADKASNYVADQTLSGVDPKSTVLSGDVTISEDEGLTAGKSYVMKLVNDADAVLAQTPVVMK